MADLTQFLKSLATRQPQTSSTGSFDPSLGEIHTDPTTGKKYQLTPNGKLIGDGINTGLYNSVYQSTGNAEAAKQAALTGQSPTVNSRQSYQSTNNANDVISSQASEQTSYQPTSNSSRSRTYSNEEVSNAINKLGAMMYGGNVMPETGSASDILKLQDQMAKDRLNRTGMYSYDGGYALSPDQLSSIDNSAEDIYNQRLQTIGDAYQMNQSANKSSNLNAETGLTPSQSSLFNSVASEYFKSPLVAANDRTVVLRGVVDKIKSSPEMAEDAAMQRNLVYSYIQALDTYQSAVREGEIDGVTALDSRIGSLINEVTKINQGQTVRPEVAIQIADAAKMLVDTISSGAISKEKQFKARASAVGLGNTWDNFINQGGGISSNTDDTNGEYQLVNGKWQ